jgi:hypothetical protein
MTKRTILLPVLALSLAACEAGDLVAPMPETAVRSEADGSGIIGSGNRMDVTSTAAADNLGQMGSGYITSETSTAEEEDSTGTLGSGSRSGYAIGGI